MADLIRLTEEVSRQRQRLDSDFVPRQIGLAITCILFFFFLPFWFVFLIYLLCIGSEAPQRRMLLAFEAEPSRKRRLAFLASSAFGLAIYSIPALVLWQMEDPLVRFMGVLSLIGALLNVSVVRSVHLPMGLVSGLPPAAALLWLPVQHLLKPDAALSAAVATAAVLALLGYFLSALVQNHRAQSRLIDAITEASEASSAKSRFLAAMSHEVRTPLNALLGHSQSMREEADADAMRGHAAQVESAARMLKMLVEDVIDLSQLTEGEILFRPVTAVIRQELEQAAATKIPMRGGPDPEIGIEIATEVPEFGRFDPVLLRKCLAHFFALVAADQPTGTAPRMDLRCALAPGRQNRLRITVAGRPGANGSADAPISAVPGGESLAQTVAHRIAGVMGGKAGLMRTPDGSLVARVELPFITIPEPPATGAETVYGRLRVLVVDDVATNRTVVAQMLRSLRIEVIEADGGSDALEWLKAEAFDLVLLDMNMPDMDGEATFREIRGSGADWADIPVIALTADAVTYQRDHYVGLGLDGYVTKPVDKRLLWAEILTAAPPPPPL